jgi:hypothetical protein
VSSQSYLADYLRAGNPRFLVLGVVGFLVFAGFCIFVWLLEAFGRRLWGKKIMGRQIPGVADSWGGRFHGIPKVL